jgi:hypothetical protein
MPAQRYNAAQHFDAVPAEHGGVRLRLRRQFRDGTNFLPGTNNPPVERVGKSEVHDENEMMGSFLGEDGVARPKLIRDQNGAEKVISTLFVFGPMRPGQSYRFQKLQNDCIAVQLVSDPDQLIGDTVTPGAGSVQSKSMDRAVATFVANGRGSDAQRLRGINQLNKRAFGRV